MTADSLLRWANWIVLLLLLQACASTPPAPVEDRGLSSDRRHLPQQQRITRVPDQYRIVRGDSLYSIAFRFGLDFREVAGWNNIRAPYVIYPDQVLRLTAPSRPVASTTQQPSTTRPKASAPNKPAPKPVISRPAASKPTTKPAASAPQPVKTPPPARTGSLQWQWPTEGRIAQSFSASDPARSGIKLAGREGQNVRAVEAGQVVYSGNGLIGYGELIIIKHNDQLLSAYGHNSRRLVEEGDLVQVGQKISEMGKSGTGTAMLHFEIRSNGKPVNPLNYLPGR